MAVANLTDDDIKVIMQLAKDEKIADRVGGAFPLQTDYYFGDLVLLVAISSFEYL